MRVHWSGKKLARAISELADLDKFKIYSENVQVVEQEETKRLMSSSGEQTDIQNATAPGILESDPATALA